MLPNVGDRIEIDFSDPEYPNTLVKGARGTVESINTATFQPGKVLTQIWVLWDRGNCMALIPERGDTWRVLEEEQ